MPFVNTPNERDNLSNLSKGMRTTADQIDDLVKIMKSSETIEKETQEAFDKVRSQVDQISEMTKFIQEQ